MEGGGNREFCISSDSLRKTLSSRKRHKVYCCYFVLPPSVSRRLWASREEVVLLSGVRYLAWRRLSIVLC